MVISSRVISRRFVKSFLLKTPNLIKTMESTTIAAGRLDEVQKSHFHVSRDKLSCDETGRKASSVPRQLRLRYILGPRFGVKDPRAEHNDAGANHSVRPLRFIQASEILDGSPGDDDA